MAVTPQELEKSFEKEIDIFENQIDDYLRTKKVYKGGTVSIDMPKSMTITHFQGIQKRYLAAGWSSVKYYDSQKDGAWIEFKY